LQDANRQLISNEYRSRRDLLAIAADPRCLWTAL